MGSRRDLARRLGRVDDFDEPSVDLEQYLTSPDLAASICHTAAMQGDLQDRPVVDLGTGTGMLALGARTADPSRIVGLDVDAAALAIARSNEHRLYEKAAIDWVRSDATRPPLSLTNATVLSNPPFGAQHDSAHGDRPFLNATSELASVSYTVHNEGSRSFVDAFAADAGASVTHAFAAELPVDRRFDFHTEDRSVLPVEVYRIEWP
ncbi:METTL5 family protein [Halovivax limisalsi]|uniref:METTL5 family protein n=1 Tax=Halovivax limisalsi TaxID=1453760 RepID=UPI001FFD35F3|nr:METTL5 family protein [Halovivax limisalsi]